MKADHVPSSPHFFRPVVRSLLAWVAALVLAAVVLPAPLQHAADPAHAPNPAKAAWFLLWIQELVSYGTAWVYPVVGLVAVFTALPWMRRAPMERAGWFQRGERLLAAVSALLALAVLVLTLVAIFLRGEQWRLIVPF